MGETTLSLWGLFISAFISSTVLPGGSEILLVTMTNQNEIPHVTLLVVATFGNTLGGMTTWGLGRLLAIRMAPEKLKPAHHVAIGRIRRWGKPLLLFSWVPIIGDPICLGAGWLQIHWAISFCLIALGKLLRYALLMYLSLLV